MSLDFWVLFPLYTLEGASINGEADYLDVMLDGILLSTVDNGSIRRGTWTHVGPLNWDFPVYELPSLKYRGRTFSFDLYVSTANGFDPGFAREGYGLFLDDVRLQVSPDYGATLPPSVC